MIAGRVRNREAILDIEVSGPSELPCSVQAILDTGYNGYLAFPPKLVKALKLKFAGDRRGTLANGTVTRLDVY